MAPTRDETARAFDPPASGPAPPRLGLTLKAELARAAVRHTDLRAAWVLALDETGDGALEVRAAWPEGSEGLRVPRAPGAIDRALADGRTEIAADFGAELTGLQPAEAGAGGIVAPIRVGAGVAGVLVGLAATPSQARDPAVVELLETFARVIAVEMELTARQRDADDARARTDSLIDAGIALASEHDLDELLQRLAQTAREVLGARYAALGVVDPDRTELVQFVTAGLDEEQRAAIGTLPRGRGILGVLIRDARPLRLDRIADDPRSVGFPAHHPAMESFLGVPIALRGEVFGNLYVTEKVDCPFTEADERLALTLAAQAAVAIDGARRIERERRRAAELESLQELAQAILATLDLDHLLPLVALRTRTLTGAATVAVALRDGEGLTVRYAHGLGALVAETVRAPADPAALASRLAEALSADAVEVATLELGGELAGALVALGPRPFDEGARRLLATFSSQVAVALSNARAFAEERERLLTSAAVQAARDREQAAAESHRLAIAAQEAERARIARELHDETGQALSALAVHLRALEDDVSSDDGRERLRELRRMVATVGTGVRELATELRPWGLREQGLAHAIRALADRLRASHGLEVELAIGDLPRGLPVEVESAIFRVVQEALTNVVRHSGAAHASVLATAHGGRLRLVVEDDGRGFDPAAPTARLGLVGIRERVELLGGDLRIESAPGAGAAVIVDLTLAPP